jgi:hypothetical protein
MIKTIAIPQFPLNSAVKLLKTVVSLQRDRDESKRNCIALICDSNSSTLTLKSPISEQIWAWVKLDATFDDEFIDDCWLELDVDFFSTLLDKTTFGRHIQLTFDNTANAMQLISGTFHQGDLVTPAQFIANDDSSTLRQNITLPNTLSDYDTPFVEKKDKTLQINKSVGRVLKRLDEFNNAQRASVTDHVSINCSSNNLFVESTNFSVKLQNIEHDLDECAVLNANAFHALQKSLNLIRISPESVMTLHQEGEQLILQTEVSTVCIKSQEQVYRPCVTELPKVDDEDILVLNREACMEALKKLDAKQKKNEDFVYISLIEFDAKSYCRLESEPENGHLTSLIPNSLNSNEFNEIKTLRSAFLACLNVFIDDEYVMLYTINASNDEFFVTNKSKSRYIALQKLPHAAVA